MEEPRQPKLLAPHTVEVHTEGNVVKEDLLWDMGSNPKEVANKLCSQLRLPATHEKEVEHQLERTLRNFRDASVGAPTVAIQYSVPLGKVEGGELLLLDKLIWDLNRPLAAADAYAAALCKDLGLGWLHMVLVLKTLRAKIEACRKELALGTGRVSVVPPLPTVKRHTPSSYPQVVRVPKRAKTAAAEDGSEQQQPGIGTPVKTEPAELLTPTATPLKAEPTAAAAVPGQAGVAAEAAAPRAAAPEPSGPAFKEEQSVGEAGGSDQPGMQTPMLRQQGLASQAGGVAGGAGVEEEKEKDSDMPDLGFD